MQSESWQRALAEGRSWTTDEAARAVAACDASGMTTGAFARQHGATAGRVLYWRKRLRESGRGCDARLLPVSVVERGPTRVVERAPGRVVLVEDGVRVEMEGMSPEWVATLIGLLRESKR